MFITLVSGKNMKMFTKSLKIWATIAPNVVLFEKMAPNVCRITWRPFLEVTPKKGLNDPCERKYSHKTYPKLRVKIFRNLKNSPPTPVSPLRYVKEPNIKIKGNPRQFLSDVYPSVKNVLQVTFIAKCRGSSFQWSDCFWVNRSTTVIFIPTSLSTYCQRRILFQVSPTRLHFCFKRK